jgi:hypothetical protein
LEVRQLDKPVDELARGKAMEKVMEHGAFDHHSISSIKNQLMMDEL